MTPEEILCVSDGNEDQGVFEEELKEIHPKVQVIVNKEPLFLFTLEVS